MDYYLENCNFDDTERTIIELRRKDVSLVGMARRLNRSPSSISDKLASIKRKMEELDRIKPYSA